MGLREQAGRVLAAGRRLAEAHVVLAKAELGAIVTDATGVAARAAVAVAALLYVAILLSIATPLFLGEWIFGSLGWGILHAVLLSIALAVALALDALRVSRRYLGGTFLLAAALGVVVAIVLGFAWPNAAWAAVGDAALPGVDPGVRPLLVGIAGGALALALLGLVVGARLGGGAVGGLAGGALLGVLVGAGSAISFDLRVGVAVGIAVGLAAWPILAALALRGYDWEALKERFIPRASIDAALQTKAFVETRLRRGKEDEA